MPPKVIIIAAGPTRTGKYRFPPNAKPKNLFHYNGETLLDRQLRMFRECGIESFRLVVGYRANDLIAYNKARGLGLEIVYNQDWEKDVFKTIRLALKGLDEDVVLVFADTVFLSKLDLKKFLNAKNPMVGLCRWNPKKKIKSTVSDAFKINREKLPLIRRLEELDITQGRKMPEMLRVFLTLRNLAIENGTLMFVEGVIDLDFYGQTDEGGGRRRRKKRGLSLAQERKRK